jgi:glycopeptide antibiotics resistance protein
MSRRGMLAIVLIAYLVFLLDIALFRFPADHPTANFVPFRSIIDDWYHGGWPFVINFVGNIVAFVPMGLLPPLIFKRPTKLWEVLVFTFSLSLLIEGGQLISGRRVPDVDDLILNVLGGLLGYLLVLWHSLIFGSLIVGFRSAKAAFLSRSERRQ